MMKEEVSDEEIINALSDIGRKVLEQMMRGENPFIEMKLRTLSNVYFDERDRIIKLGNLKQKRYFLNVAQSKKFMQTLLVAERIKWLLERNRSLSKRQLFYTLKHTIPGTKENTFDEQDESDDVLEDLEVTIDVLVERFNIIADSKGVMAGPLVVEDKGDVIDLTKMGSAGYAVPGIVEPDVVKFKECSADYVLVVEKAAVWNLLNEDRFWEKENCILLTGKGQPSRAERRMVHRLHKELGLPVYVFTDMDPWGYYIYSVYKQGSINLAHFSMKCGVPEARFIGFCTADVKQFNMPSDSFIKMKDVDYKRIDELMNYEWFKNKEWQNELKTLKKFGNKIEQDALVMKGLEFTAKEYLPTKIENKMFLP